MKTSSTITLLVSLLLSITTYSQTKEAMEIYFPTTGNCYLCKVRIENAASKLLGVETVVWDAGTDVTTITFDDTQMDAHVIMQTISNVGHETEWFPANDSAYAELEGTCCLYTKVIDYSNVQIGYLSMMDLWLWELTGINNLKNHTFQVFPTAGNGLFTITGSSNNPNTIVTVEVFTINGQQVHTDQLTSAGAQQINLSYLNKGCYLVVLSNGNQILNKTKVFKN